MKQSTSCILLGLTLACGQAFSTDTPKLHPDTCDAEWDRIKSLPPIRKSLFDLMLVDMETERRGVQGGARPLYPRVDTLYLLARTPSIIGAEQVPTDKQRDDWLAEAAAMGHKAAKAALLRLRYLGPQFPDRPRVTREEYLVAAREAAEAGDPEFATVMMDTARNINRIFHCRDEESPIGSNGCAPQKVTKPIETRSWAEAAARGGNPGAKELLCKMFHFGTYPEWGFYKNEQLAFQWCFAAAHNACTTADASLMLSTMYANGTGVAKDAALSSFWASFSKRNRDLFWPTKSK